MKNKIVVLMVMALISSVFIATEELFAFSDSDITTTLTEGGYRLELNATGVSKGVKIDINNANPAMQYQLVQRINRPLQNQINPGAVIGDEFVVRGLSGSDPTKFRLSPSDIPVKSDTLLYLSDAAGTGSSFTLVYSISDFRNLKPGDYSGQIAYVLSPVNAPGDQVNKMLDIYVTVSDQDVAKATIQISTDAGGKRAYLNPKKEGSTSADIWVKVSGAFRNQFNISQYLTRPLESDEGIRLGNDAVNFVVKESKKGIAVNQATPLSSGIQNVYSSMPSGDADEYFRINYSLGDLSKIKAGKYRSVIQYLLEEAGGQAKIDQIDLEIENEKIFDLDVTPVDQKYAIEFRDIKASEPPKTSEVEIQINSNAGKQYQVSQDVFADLTNKEGDVISSQYFTLRTDSDDTKGNLKFPEKQEVRKGSTVLFVSNNDGDSDKFKVIYELNCPQGTKAGDYATRITYSLLEI